MKISFEYLFSWHGSNAPDGLHHIKRLEWLSVVECLKGKYIFSYDNSPTVEIGPREFFIAPSGVLQDIVHRTDENGEFACQYIFLTAVTDGMQRLDDIYDFPPKLPNEYNDAMHDALSELEALGETEYCLHYACAYRIADLLLRCATPKKHARLPEKAVQYITEHLTEPISVQDLCRAASLSESELFRQFAAAGNTPVKYINARRLTLACTLLTREQMSIEKTAQACGFESQSYFNRVFRKRIGMTPSQYRKQYYGYSTFGMPSEK